MNLHSFALHFPGDALKYLPREFDFLNIKQSALDVFKGIADAQKIKQLSKCYFILDFRMKVVTLSSKEGVATYRPVDYDISPEEYVKQKERLKRYDFESLSF